MPKVIGKVTKFEKFNLAPLHASVPSMKVTPTASEAIVKAESLVERNASQQIKRTTDKDTNVALGPSDIIARAMSLDKQRLLATGAALPSTIPAAPTPRPASPMRWAFQVLPPSFGKMITLR